jgi:hypothetical protein
MLSFSGGKLNHGGEPISKGDRYILTAFLFFGKRVSVSTAGLRYFGYNPNPHNASVLPSIVSCFKGESTGPSAYGDDFVPATRKRKVIIACETAVDYDDVGNDDDDDKEGDYSRTDTKNKSGKNMPLISDTNAEADSTGSGVFSFNFYAS